MKMTLGITNKLMVLSLFFIFIFYGTLLILFVNVQRLMETSEQIVTINNQIAMISKTLHDSLINMDVNDKKFRLLKKDVYRNYFETAREEFCHGLDRIMQLDSPDHRISGNWEILQESFNRHIHAPVPATPDNDVPPWAEDSLVEGWMDNISDAGKENQQQIDLALIQINTLGRQSVRNSLIGLGVSICAGILGAVFISKSMIKPLKTLKNGIKNISHGNDFTGIKINSNDEFSDLADAFNDMSRQLKEDEDIRSDFIATLSHEIRTPLSSTRESVNMICEEVLGPVNDQQKKFLKIAGHEIKRISDLLDHLLDVSLLESDSGRRPTTPIDPNLLIQEMSGGLNAQEKTGKVTILYHELKSAPMVMGIKKEILQVLSNIIGNAVKFSYKNGVVDVSVINEKSSSFLTFKISDQGPGISEEEQSLIFKKYYRAKNVRNHMDGVGLGLNISKRIIHAHGGKIYMENNTDKGCSFFFTLPKVS